MLARAHVTCSEEKKGGAIIGESVHLHGEHGEIRYSSTIRLVSKCVRKRLVGHLE